MEDVERIRQLAMKGDPEAQNRLGDMSYEGTEIAKDNAEAVLWYRKAAEQGYAEAQKNLGWMYCYGEGVPQNDAEALFWYRKAAEQGYAEAQYSLSLMYLGGKGVPQNDEEAAAWCRKAAEQGHADACFNLRWMYRNGKAVPEVSEKHRSQSVFKSDQAQNIIQYLRDIYNDELEFLWPRFPNNAVFRRKDTGKWYGALLTLSGKKLGLDPDEIIEIIDLRARPEEIASLVDMRKYFPGYHMNKKNWYTVCLDGSVQTDEIFKRIDDSYRLAFK